MNRPDLTQQLQRLASALLILALAACSAPGPAQPTPTYSPEPGPPVDIRPTPAPTLAQAAKPAVPASFVQSEKPRQAAPQVSADELAGLVSGHNTFAFDLYRQLAAGGGNLFYSPYSIYTALAMTQAGARGETLDEMDAALSFNLPQDRLHTAINALDQSLAEQAAEKAGEDAGPFHLNIANSIWGQRGYSFLPEYLDLLSENYGAGMRLVDYAANTEAARQAINDWIAQQTEDRIKDLIPAGVLNELTRLVLANAIYFNAAWLSPFDESATAPAPFHPLEGEPADVDMMRQSGSFGVATGEGWQLVELPYASRSMVMDVILPAEGGFAEFEAGLTGDALEGMLQQVNYTQVKLALPKFKVESDFSLKEPLAGLGMEQAFVPGQADFSGMDGSHELYIQDALHKAFVSVDEAGTEAAAATVVIVGIKSAPMEPLSVTVDRPFVFLIRDSESGAILFVGRVVALQ